LRLARYFLAFLVLAAWTTQACLAKTPRPVSKSTGSVAAPANAGAQRGPRGSGATNPATAKPDAGNPIDTRIAEPRRGPPSNSRPIDAKQIGVVGLPATLSRMGTVPGPLGLARSQNFTPRPPGGPRKVLVPPGPAGPTRNAIGSLANPRAATTGLGGKGSPAVAAGGGVQPGLPRASAAPPIGTPSGHSLAGSTPSLASRVGAPAVARAAPASPTGATNHGIINGTAMARPVSGPTTIGGAARNVTVGINGTGFRGKHP
jgi:hypothetical protein